MPTKREALPCNPDAERVTLGAAIMDRQWQNVLCQRLNADDFFDPRNKRIFSAVNRMVKRGAIVDRVTIAAEFQDYGELEAVGGLSYVMGLDDGLPEIINLEAYIERIAETSRQRKLLFAAEAIQQRILSRNGDTSIEISRDAQSAFSEIVDPALTSRAEKISEYLDNYDGGINAFLDPSKYDKGLPTGFPKLDEWTDGFHESEIFLIGARPGTGKSALALNISKNIAARGRGVAFFSLEMSKKTCIYRMICDEGAVAFNRFRSGDLDADERMRVLSASSYIRDLPIHIDDQSALRVPDLRIKLQAILNKESLALVVVDFVQLMRASSKKTMSENEKYTEIANELQELNKSLKIPMLLLSQLSRESEKGGEKRPKLSQTRGTGTWEQCASVGAVLWRPGEKERREREDLRNAAELIIDKNRGGITGTVNLKYFGWRYRFEDAETA